MRRGVGNSAFSDVGYKDNDNLIIKGNNLIALYSILRRFEKKIKCIYIDPPYNTGNDSFKYNDSFNHSTWLTFMKNRLEVAKRLLKDDGVIFVQCDDNEMAYLKVLMDEVFEKKYISTISVKSSSPSGVKTAHACKTILKSHDFILCFVKNKTTFNPQYIIKNKWDTHYMFFIEDKKVIPLVDKLIQEELLNKTQTLKDFDINNPINKQFYKTYGDFIVRKSTHKNDTVKNTCNSDFKDKIYKAEDGNYYLNDDMLQPISKSFHDVLYGQKIINDTANLLCDFWDDIDFQNTQNQGCVSFPSGKKPEQLLYRILSLVTNPGDIVLDFFMGSGTTCAVAHKMGRQYIGIEQMDYIKTISVPRLIKVIEGETGGISKAVNWQGGGSFIYCELKEDGISLIEKVQNANEKNIQEIKNDIFNDDRIIPYISKKELINAENDFEGLSLEEKKAILLKLINKNMLYINYCNIDDESINLSKNDREFNIKFYEREDN